MSDTLLLESEAVTVVAEATAMLFLKTGRSHEPVAVPQVRLRPGEVLVEIEFATVCSSDVHTVLGHRIEPAPLVLGHEAVGRVTHLGPGLPHAVSGRPVVPGDRVVWSVAAHCGNCDRCLRGLEQKCRGLRKYGHARIGPGWELTGGFATYAHLLAGTPIVHVDELAPVEALAPIGCGIATAWAAVAAVERTVACDGSSVLITGGGLIGLAATAMATERGARVTLSDPDPERRALAKRFGAVRAIEPQQLCGGSNSDFDAVIEASGSPRAVAAGLEAAAIGAAVVWVGSVFPTEPVEIVPERVVRGLLSVSGVHNYRPEHLACAAAFVERHWRDYPFDRLVGEIYPLLELDDALERAAEAREVRVGIDPRLSRRHRQAQGTTSRFAQGTR